MRFAIIWKMGFLTVVTGQFFWFLFSCALTCKGMYGKNCIWTKVVVFGPQTAEKTVRKLMAALMN